MKKFLFFALTLVFVSCGQDDDEVNNSERTGGSSEDATSSTQYKFLEEGATRLDVSIDCSKCSEDQQQQSYTLFLDEVSTYDLASLRLINYYSYDSNYCGDYTDPAFIELTVTYEDSSTQAYHILDTACSFELNTEGRFITKNDYEILANYLN